MLYFISVLSLVLSLISSLEAVLTRVEVFTLDYQERKTTVILLYDVHQIPEFAERENQQTEELVQAIQDCSLKQYKYLSILAEQAPDLEVEHKEPITCFIKNINAKVKDLYGTATNIEQRAASILIEDLINYYPDHSQCTVTRSTASKIYYAQEVTLQDALDELEMMDKYVKEAYSNASDKVPQIYQEKMVDINYFYKNLKKLIEENNIPTTETFRYVLDVIRQNTEEQYQNYLHPVIVRLKNLLDLTANDYFDLYILDKILSAPDGQTTVVLAGAEHCRYVLSRILGGLNAEDVFCCGLDESYKESIQPLTQEQIAQLFA